MSTERERREDAIRRAERVIALARIESYAKRLSTLTREIEEYRDLLRQMIANLDSSHD